MIEFALFFGCPVRARKRASQISDIMAVCGRYTMERQQNDRISPFSAALYTGLLPKRHADGYKDQR